MKLNLHALMPSIKNKLWLTLLLSICLSAIASAQQGAALNFDGGDDYVAIPHNNVLNVSQFTLETWIKWDRANTDFICSKGGEQMEIHLNADNSIRFIPTNGVYLDAPAGTIPAGAWAHIAYVYDPSGAGLAKLYVNGVEVALANSGPNAITTAMNNNGNAFILGSRGPNSFPYLGAIDEFRIWNRALCQAEIVAHKDCELVGNQVGLVAYYQFNQGLDNGDNTAITTVTDATSNANNAAINNFTLNGATSNFVAVGGVTTGTACTSFALPEINVQSNSNNILDGSTSIAITNNTDFGNVNLNATLAKTYTIQNTGIDALNISSITSSNSYFAISGAPATVAAGGSATFTVTFTAATAVLQTATITVNNDDCNESVYDFAVQGSSLAPSAALNFDGGDDYLGPNTSSNATLAGPFTLETWIKLAPTGEPYPTIFSKSVNNFAIYLEGNNGGVWNLTMTSNGGYLGVPAAITENVWTHLAITHDGTTANIYIDGVLKTSGGIPQPTVSGEPTIIGAWYGIGRHFKGDMDEFRIWNRALCLPEMDAHRNCELVGNELGLAGYYQFNQGLATGNNTSITSATDATSNGDDFTMQNFANNGASSNFVAPGGVTTGTTCTPFALPTATIAGTTTICAGTNTTLTASSGNTTDTFAWSTGDATAAAAVTPTTTTIYTVTVTTAQGCKGTATVEVVTTAPTAAIAGTTSACFGSTATLTASGGDTYAWSGGATPTTDVNTFDTSGAYTVTVTTTSTGCTATASQIIVINPIVTPSITQLSSSCTPVTIGTVDGVSFVWSTTQTDGIITVTASDTYTVTVTTGDGCTGTATFAATVFPLPTPTISGTATGTGCDAVNLTASGGSTYAWSGGATPATAANTFSAVGTYTVTVTDGNACTATADQLVSVNIPTPVITGTPTACGGTVDLTASGGATYAWSGGATPTTDANTFNASGDYTVTVTDGASGCTATASQTVTIYTLPTATIAGTTTGCGSVALTASGGNTYQWSGGNSNNTDANTFTTSGDYTVIVTDANNCFATTSQTVTVNAPPPIASISATPASVCTGGSSVLAASATAPTYCQPNSYNCNVVGAIGNVTFAGINKSSGCDSYSYNTTINPTLVAGTTYPLYIAADDTEVRIKAWIDYNQDGVFSGGEEINSGVYISSGNIIIPTNALSGKTRLRVRTVNQDVPTPCGNLNYSETEDYDVTITGGITTATYAWSPTTFLGSTTGASVNATNITSATTYTVTAADPTTGCTATATVEVTVNALPTPAIAGTTTACGSVVLTASGGNAYAWSGGATPTTDANIFATSGTYTVTVTDANGCSATTAETVTVNALPTIGSMSATPATVCNGGSSVLEASALAYCLIGNYCNSGDIISNVTFATINRSSGCDDVNNYFTTFNPTLTAGTAYPMSVSTSTTSPESAAAWIDYNQDGVFSANEQIFSDVPTGPGAIYTATATIPTTAINGKTRLRVRCGFGTNNFNDLTDPPCSGVLDGETEDYDVTITGGTTVTSSTTYAWSPTTFLGSTTGASVSATNITAATTYTVTATDAIGCTATATVEVAVNTVNVAIAGATAVCDATSTVLTASGGTSYAWSGGATPTTDENTFTSSGIYTVTVTDAAIGCATSSSVRVVLVPTLSAPTVSPSSIALCGATPTLVSVSGSNVNGYVLQINPIQPVDAQFSADGSLLPNSGFLVQNLLPGTYYVGATYRTVIADIGLFECFSPQTALTVTQAVSILPTVANNTLCADPTASLSATTTNGTIDWYDASAGGTPLTNVASGAAYTVTPTANTTYYAGVHPAEQLTFAATGAPQTFTVPAGVTSLEVFAAGAQGASFGNGSSGQGGIVQTTLAVIPGQILNIYVGGSGDTGGYNGGGNAGTSDAGGGATDIRTGTGLTSRLVVAGGGGAFGGFGANTSSGYAGGGLIGGGQNNAGGSQTAGGIGGTGAIRNGSLGNGGNGNSNGSGGGGYYGGGGYGGSNGGGGGGSSYTDPTSCSNVVHVQGGNQGNGYLRITWGGGTSVCASDRVPVTVNVAEKPVFANSTVCTPTATADLVATASVGTIDWYATPTGGAPLTNTASGATYTVTPTANATTYYAQINAPATVPVTQNFAYTGLPQTFTVPAGVNTIYAVVVGAGSGTSSTTPANGGTVATTITVTPGQVLNLYIGSRSGYNGGGTTNGYFNGGGASDIRTSTTLQSRIAVAGGGGGSGNSYTGAGAGGGLTGGDGDSGLGGTQTAGGLGGQTPALDGILGVGGNGGQSLGGGGGGGYYGGGGGNNDGSGGGGSSYTDPTLCSNPVHTQGNNPGNGSIAITWGEVPCVSTLRTPVTVKKQETIAVANAVVCADNNGTAALAATTSQGSTVNWYNTATGGTPLTNVASGASYTATATATTTFYAAIQPTAQVFNYTGAPETFTVPAGVTSVNVIAKGAEGRNSGGGGGTVTTTLTVIPGDILNIYVGGGYYSYNGGGSNGGGATDIRTGSLLSTRLVVAGGGGGGGVDFEPGGGGGGLIGGNGGSGGGGGSQTMGGTSSGDVGVFGIGGSGNGGGGGGGGGYYGGGGGGNSGGGGGSSYTDPTLCSNVVHTQGDNAGDGYLKISWGLNSDCVSADRVPVLLQIPEKPVFANSTVCTPTATADLVATASVGTIDWYATPTGGAPLTNTASGATYTVTPTANATTYYAQINAPATVPVTQNFAYTGAAQTFTVPTGVNSLNVTAKGAKGGDVYSSVGGSGGTVQTTLSVIPGQVLNLYVGAMNGYNGGGSGNAPGGGASDIRTGSLLSTRIVVAGGGGGANGGGAGGGLIGGDNLNSGSGGGSQSAGGTGTFPGSLGLGGSNTSNPFGSGGGGGGYYGGGGSDLGGGGGGSSYTDSNVCSNPVHTQGNNTGDGSIAITWDAPPCVSTFRTPVTVKKQETIAIANAIVCADNNGTAALSATTSQGSTVNWYNTATGGTPLTNVASGASYTATATATTTFYAAIQPTEQEFNYTGAPQTFTVPAGVTSVNVVAKGAKGTVYGSGNTPRGGTVQTTLSVTPGQVLNVYVGNSGGYNGGGIGNGGGNGGGATDIRTGSSLATRLVVAGGAGGDYNAPSGVGGGLIAGDGNQGGGQDAGYGGSQTAGGAGSDPGTLGLGGNSASNGGGGGGGYYGGGAGKNYYGGGGGSSYTDPTLCSNVLHTQGNNIGEGYLKISWGNSDCVSADRVPVVVIPGLKPSVANDTLNVCGTQAVNLVATTSTGTIDWYATPTGGAPLTNVASGAPYSVTPTASGTYYAQINTSGTTPTPLTTANFGFTGAPETFTVPTGVTSLTVIAKGAQGGGLGGSVTTNLAVIPGDVLHIFVGGSGGTPNGGYNGGGNGGNINSVGGGGGGATDIRFGSTTLTDRIVVAGGGGGGTTGNPSNSGLGGGLIGGLAPNYGGGTGGTATAGGTGGGATGGSGYGGNGSSGDNSGGGGGGGYFGGGGGIGDESFSAGGGGGSSYTDPTRCSNVVHTQGDNAGNGSLLLVWGTCVNTARTPVTVNVNSATATLTPNPTCLGAPLTATLGTGGGTITDIAWLNSSNARVDAPATYTPAFFADKYMAGGVQQSLNYVIDIITDAQGNVYVANIQNIVKYPPNSTPATIGVVVAGTDAAGSATNQLNSASAIAFDSQGNLYVSDANNNRIQKFPVGSTEGTNAVTVAGGNGYGSAANQLEGPAGIFIDANDNLYVTDYRNHRVQKFPAGSTSATNGVTVAGGNGQGIAANQLNKPFGITLDATGNMYIADYGNHRIQKFPANSTSGTNGVTIAGGSGYGSALNQLDSPADVLVTADGSIFVMDEANNRVLRFPANSTSATNGTIVAGTGTEGNAVNQLSYAEGLTIAQNGTIYVSDGANGRIQKYTPNPNITYTPTVVGDYTATIVTSAGCTITTAPATVNDCTDIVYSGTAACQTYSVGNVSGNQWFDIYGATGIICSINPNGENLGTVTVTTTDPTGVILSGSGTFVGRDVDIQSSFYESGLTIPTAYSLRLYYYDTELTTYQQAIGATSLTPASLNVVWASGGAGCGLATYALSATQNGVIDKAIVAEAEYGVSNNGFYLGVSLDHFTIFAATASSTPLPVKLLSFSGKTVDKTNVLTWATATEQNNSGFEVQRSTDGTSFSKIGFVRGAGNSTTQKDYTFTDNRVIANRTTYYRLKQIDLDNQFEYSNTISLGARTATTLAIYPNPSTGVFTLDGQGWSGQTAVTVTNSLGQNYQIAITNNQIDLTNLASGVYFLQVLNDGEPQVIKLVKL